MHFAWQSSTSSVTRNPPLASPERRISMCDSQTNLQIKLVKHCFVFLSTAYETTPSRPHLALFTCLFLLMSFLGVAMYCTDRRRPQRVCEELEAALAVYLLHMKQLLWGCWIWLTMQWLTSTRGGEVEPPVFLFFSYPSFSYLSRCPSLQAPQPFGEALSAVWC